ncbi:hypothetical protein UR09_06365 [Candidatus Nitromaritima sp. SCGC AAA799-A02]|nr:hypothetical protein UR09_06365 [Candidatus Nitromaritima sp. SCGC AAA799-A02]
MLKSQAMTRFFASVLAVYFLGWQMPLTYAETLFVKSSNTNVYERDSIQSKIVQLVQEGTEVNTIQKSKLKGSSPLLTTSCP